MLYQTILTENNIKVNEVEAYQTKLDGVKVNESVEGVMFYSPSTVQSLLKENKAKVLLFVLVKLQQQKLRKHFEDVRIAKVPTVESVIELVNEHYSLIPKLLF